MQPTDLKDLTTTLLSGNASPLEDLFRNVGADTPKIQFDPIPDTIGSTRLRSLLDYWMSLPRGKRLPLTEAIDAVDIGPAIGIVMLLEPTEDPYEFRYRLYGSEIAAFSKLELTRKTTAAIPSPEMRAYFQVTYAASIRSGRSMLCDHRTPPAFSIVCWSRLILPCEDGTGRINRLLVGNEPAIPSFTGRGTRPRA